MLEDAQPGSGASRSARRPAARIRAGLDIAGDWANRKPRQVGLTFALLVSVVMMAVTGCLAYVTASSAGASGHVGVAAADWADHAARRAQVAWGTIRLMSLTPAAGSAGVTGARTLQITFSAPIAANTVMPKISPATPGQWLVTGNMLTFTPDTSFAPATSFTITIPAGATGLRSLAGGMLAKPMVVKFSTERYAPLRLVQLLGELGYLPLSWQPVRGHGPAGVVGSGLPAQQAMAYSPPAGVFTWQPGYQAMLRSQWRSDESSPVVRGAVMAFQAQHGMTVDGVVSPRLWHALFVAADDGHRNTAGYPYTIAP